MSEKPDLPTSKPLNGKAFTGTTAGPIEFISTAWSVILGAQDSNTDVARRYLHLLIQRYWRPVYFFIRQTGKPHEDAKDLTQGFFTLFLEKDIIAYADRLRGRFRFFLLASIRRYLALEHRIEARRPVEILMSGIEAADGEPAFLRASAETPESTYMRNWAKCLLENCVARLQSECEAVNKLQQFRVFEARFLRADPAGSRQRPAHRTIAAELGITETDVRNYLSRARQRFIRIVRSEVAQASMSPEEVDEEIQELIACLAGA